MINLNNDNKIDREHALILQAWSCIIGSQKIRYLSGPITSGMRWVAAIESGSINIANVISENSADILQSAEDLRSKDVRILLEPASLSIRGWSQADYLKLWTTLIEMHAHEVIFMPDWEYSIGCAQEFQRAVNMGIPTRMSSGQKLITSSGIAALDEAVADLSVRSISHRKLLPLRDQLDKVLKDLKASLTKYSH